MVNCEGIRDSGNPENVEADPENVEADLQVRL